MFMQVSLKTHGAFVRGAVACHHQLDKGTHGENVLPDINGLEEGCHKLDPELSHGVGK